MNEIVSASNPLESERHSWDRLENESAKAFHAFVVYRDLGFERSVGKVVTKSQKHHSLIYRWSVTYGWASRVRDWDEFQDQLLQAESLRTRIEMNRATLTMAQLMQTRAMEGYKVLETVRIVKDAKTGEEKLELAVKPAELIRMMQAAHEVTQQLLGKADEDRVAKIEVIFGSVPPEEEPPLDA